MRTFSPDKLKSNQLAAMFENTGWNFQQDEYSFGQGGRIVEISSEHTCQGQLKSAFRHSHTLTRLLPGMLRGYAMTRHAALFPSCKAFVGIVQTMMT